ncbi:Pleiotropic ABC efflux transporter of multiple drugs YBT1 [Trichinella pseudospiralis]
MGEENWKSGLGMCINLANVDAFKPNKSILNERKKPNCCEGVVWRFWAIFKISTSARFYTFARLECLSSSV